jgi:hypothetical protein
MQVVEIQNKKWMIDLEWELLPGDNSIKQEVKEIAEKTNLDFGILIEYDSIYAVGLVKKIAKKIPSASLFLALANHNYRGSNSILDYPDWICVEAINDDKYWMSVIKSGLPAPQYDVLLSISDVKEKIMELISNNNTFTVFSKAPEIINLFDGIQHIENKGLNELTQDISTKIKFEKLRGIPDSVIYTGFGIIGLCVLGFGAYSFISGRTLKEKEAFLRQQQQQQAVQKQQQYEQAMQQYQKDSEMAKQKAIAQALNGLAGNPVNILQAWFNTIGNTNVGTNNWDLKTIQCYFDNSNQPIKFACDYLYNRTGLGTNRMLLQDFPNAVISGNQAIVTVPVAINENDLKSPSEDILQKLGNASNWDANLLSQLQLMKIVNINYKIDKSQEITYKLPAKPLSPKQQSAGMKPLSPQEEKLGIAYGDLDVMGKNFDLVKELAQNADFFGTGIKNLTVKFSSGGDMSWEVKFNYYINSSNGQIANSSSKGMSTNAVPNNKNQIPPGTALPVINQPTKQGN